MKNLDLNAIGVKEMGTAEMRQTGGGVIPIAVAVAIWAIQAGICMGLMAVKAQYDTANCDCDCE